MDKDKVELVLADKYDLKLIEEMKYRKNNFNNLVRQFQEEQCVLNKKGEYDLKISGNSSVVIDEYFFKPLNEIVYKIPEYDVDKLLGVFTLYKHLVSGVNSKIDKFNPSVSQFCRFIGVPVVMFDEWKNSSNQDFKNLVMIIDDWIFDTNFRLAEGRKIDSTSAIFRAKVEQNKMEQKTPSTVIIGDVNVNEIKRRLNEIKGIATKGVD